VRASPMVNPLTEPDIEPSASPVGESFYAIAKTVIGLIKTAVIRCRGPRRAIDDFVFAAPEWVCLNHGRLLEPIGMIPTAEHGVAY